MKSTESAEMYLENIKLLKAAMPNIRAIDIVHYTGYSKPSVSRAMGLLRANGHIDIDELGYITLTDQGELLASKILERHRTLSKFFELLGVSEETASADACKIEHIISDEAFDKIKRFVADRS